MSLSSPQGSGPDVSIGERIGPYHITRKLGQGGMGVVFEAQHVELGRQVAIKLLLSASGLSSSDERHFLREAEVIAKLSHPNIVKVYDFGYTDQGCPYFVMELLSGETLRERLKRGLLANEDFLNVFVPLLAAVHAAHQNNVVHRDLKPDNVILVSGHGSLPSQVKLLDFGIAKICGDIVGVASTEATGMLVGTVAYMAPEQIRRSKAVDNRADLYAIGTMLYEALTGKRPFFGTQMEVLAGKLMESPLAPSVIAREQGILRPGLDWERVDRVVLRALATDPKGRQVDCAQLLSELAAAWADLPEPTQSILQSVMVSGGAISASAVSIPESQRATAQAPRRSDRSYFFIGGTLLTIVAAGVSWLLVRPAGNPLSEKNSNRKPIAPTQSQSFSGGPALKGKVSALVSAARNGSPEQRRNLLLAIAASHSRQLLADVTALLEDPEPAVYQAAVQAVQAMAQPADREVLAGLHTLASRTAGAARLEVALAQFQLGDLEALAVLEATVNNSSVDPNLQIRASVLLARAGRISAAALRNSLRTASQQHPILPRLQREATAELVRLHDEETKRRLISALHASDAGQRREAAEVLSRVNLEAGRDALFKLARADRNDIAAGLALAEAGDRRALELLLPRLADPSGNIRQRVVSAFGTLAERRIGCQPQPLLPLLIDPDPLVAVAAAVALSSVMACASEAAGSNLSSPMGDHAPSG